MDTKFDVVNGVVVVVEDVVVGGLVIGLEFVETVVNVVFCDNKHSALYDSRLSHPSSRAEASSQCSHVSFVYNTKKKTIKVSFHKLFILTKQL